MTSLSLILLSLSSLSLLSAEVLLLDSVLVLSKQVGDLILYVVSHAHENEIMMQTILLTLDETLQNLLKGQVTKKTVVENLDLLLLSIDEIVSDGLILETDSSLVVGRVCMVGGGPDGTGGKDIPIAEQTFTQALQTAKDQLVRSFR